MDIGGLIFFLVAVSAIVSWIIAGIRSYSYAQSKGLGYYFMHFLSAVAVVFVLWLLIVYPTLDCSGFLCGLGEVVMWILISVVLMLVWPLILLVILKRKFKDEVVSLKKDSDELLDNDIL